MPKLHRKIAICTPKPRHGGGHDDYERSLRDTLMALNEGGFGWMDPQTSGHANVCRSRNILAALALGNGATDIVFIDSDVGWDVRDFMRLINHDVDVVAGAIIRRSFDKHEYAFRWREENKTGNLAKVQFTEGNEIFQVWGAATAFMRIRRSVFQRMALRHPEWKIHWDGMPPDVDRCLYSYFMYESRPPTIKKSRIVKHNGEQWREWEGEGSRGVLEGEDYQFCRRCHAMGIGVWIDPVVRLRHWNTAPLCGSLMDNVQALRLRSEATDGHGSD